jgi:LysR family transcriptional regulator, benzoate and cis,cis-muconate-responsive activator of ben and cat genes
LGTSRRLVATIQAAVIEFQHLVYFVAVAEEGSIRAAAHRLHLTQPPLSRHMRALEKRLGVQLFTRTPRGVLLTPAGEVLLVEARDTLSRLGYSLERVQRAALGVRRIRFGYAGTAGADLIPGVIAALARQTPAIDVELAELPVEKSLAAFSRLACDAAFVRRIAGNAGDIECETLREERTVMVTPVTHRRAQARAVGLEAFAGEDLIVTRGGRDMILDVNERFDLGIRSVTEAPSIPAVLGLVASGRGIGWMAETTPVLHHHDVVSIPVDGYTTPLALAWSPALSETVRAVIRRAAAALVESDSPSSVAHA